MTEVDPQAWMFRPFTPTLSRGVADRTEDLRLPFRTRQTWPTAKVLVVDPQGRVSATSQGDVVRLEWLDSAQVGPEVPDDAVLLGEYQGTDYWAVPGQTPELFGVTDDGWAAVGGGLREWGAVLDDVEAGLLTSAVAVLGWHGRSPFCPTCGEQSSPTSAGWSRICPHGHQEFPRTDPAVIMLVHDGGDEAVLARQPSWPPHRYSVLAGFTEAGESLEATVRREVLEEVGVVVDDVRYLGSQPWPFPRSLMVGFAARTAHAAELFPRDGEIEHARWVTRDQVRKVLANDGVSDDLLMPPSISIARKMIEAWAAG